jgi:hypothetical protein
MKPTSRRLQFGLRTMLLIVTLMGVYLAWRIHDPERAAVRAIRAAGGQVHFGYQQPTAAATYIRAPNRTLQRTSSRRVRNRG